MKIRKVPANIDPFEQSHLHLIKKVAEQTRNPGTHLTIESLPLHRLPTPADYT